MDEIWRRGDSTVAEVLEGLNARSDRPRAYNTVHTVSCRLCVKSMLIRRRGDRAGIYSPPMSRAEYHEARAAAETTDLVGRYGDAALVAFMKALKRVDPAREH